MKNRKSTFALALALLTAGLMPFSIGCNGSKDVSTVTAPQAAETGETCLSVVWPNKPSNTVVNAANAVNAGDSAGTERWIPTAANSINVEIHDGRGYTRSQITARPATGNTSSLTFTEVPVGSIAITATAYASQDGSGVAMAVGSAVVAVTKRHTTSVSIDLISTITTVSINTDPGSDFQVDDTCQLIATAQNASSAVIPVLPQPNGFRWTSSNTAVATVNDSGLLTAASEGTTTLQTEERETGIRAVRTLNVKKASGTLVVTIGSEVIAVSVAPSTPSLSINATQPFTATVTGVPNQHVIWSVQEGNPGGTITEAGRYTAPATPGTYHVVAASVADESKVATAVVIVSAPQGTFTATGSMTTARRYHTATLLLNGKVLIAGGGNGGYLASAEIYDPSTGTFTATGSMATARYWPTATLLPNGKILIAGGWNGGYLASAEIFDPSTGTFTATGSMATARWVHTATLLPNGKVLIAGGWNGGYLASAEIFDPSTGTFTATGSMAAARSCHTATLLPNGKVLIARGGDDDDYAASTEIFDPSTGTFTATGSMATAKSACPTATLLPNGKVLVAGGCYGLPIASAELFDPSTGAFTVTGSMTTQRTDHTATLLSNGKVLVSGGFKDMQLYHASAELYDPSTGVFTDTWPMTTQRANHTATLLPNGKVLVAGGVNRSYSNYLASAELYNPLN